MILDDIGENHHYTLIIPLLYPYYTLIIHLLYPYYILIISLLYPYYILIISLLYPYYILIISLLYLKKDIIKKRWIFVVLLTGFVNNGLAGEVFVQFCTHVLLSAS